MIQYTLKPSYQAPVSFLRKLRLYKGKYHLCQYMSVYTPVYSNFGYALRKLTSLIEVLFWLHFTVYFSITIEKT